MLLHFPFDAQYACDEIGVNYLWFAGIAIQAI
jgi:hypothetical protein